MSDSVKKAEKMGYFNDEWNGEKGYFKKINNTFTKNQVLNVINTLSLYCEDEALLDEVNEVKEFLKSKL